MSAVKRKGIFITDLAGMPPVFWGLAVLFSVFLYFPFIACAVEVQVTSGNGMVRLLIELVDVARDVLMEKADGNFVMEDARIRLTVIFPALAAKIFEMCPEPLFNFGNRLIVLCRTL